MRTYELRGNGLETLVLAERTVPRPDAGQVLVRMHATSLNYRDLLIARGRYARSVPRLPLVPLSDGAGEVVEVGQGVTRLKRGDRVAGAFFQRWIDGPFDASKAESALGGAIDGVLSEFVVLEEVAAVKFPASLSFEEAATLPCAGVTAWNSLMTFGRLEAGQTVLAMGTGGVSLFALQFAKIADARVIITSSRDDKLLRAKTLGADEGVNYRSVPAWDVRARDLTAGRGVDQIVEVGGAATFTTSLRAVRDGGHIALVGRLTGAPADRDAVHGDSRGVRISPVYVGSVRHFEEMNGAIARTGLRPVVDRVFAFEEAQRAFKYLESADHFGKVVIRV